MNKKKQTEKAKKEAEQRKRDAERKKEERRTRRNQRIALLVAVLLLLCVLAFWMYSLDPGAFQTAAAMR
jgi:ferric-dicitrate binding protein FerR (iron transport regulator)